MTVAGLLVTVLVVQHVVLVHYLAPWAFFSRLRSLRESLILVLMVTAAMIWISLWYSVLYRYLLAPLSMEHLAAVSLSGIHVLSLLFWRAVVQYFFPHHWGKGSRMVLVSIMNVLVFVFSMAAARAPMALWQIPVAAVFVGFALVTVMVPVSATRRRLQTSVPSHVIDGSVITLLMLGVLALAMGLVHSGVESLAQPLW